MVRIKRTVGFHDHPSIAAVAALCEAIDAKLTVTFLLVICFSLRSDSVEYRTGSEASLLPVMDAANASNEPAECNVMTASAAITSDRERAGANDAAWRACKSISFLVKPPLPKGYRCISWKVDFITKPITCPY